VNIMMFLFWLGCSLNTTPIKSCQTHVDCQYSFGFGHICGSNGLCSELQPIDRCFLSFPSEMYSLEMGDEFDENIVVDWSTYGNNKIVGVLFDHSFNQPRIDAVNLAAHTVRDNFGEDFILVHCDYQNDDFNEFDGLHEEEAVQVVTSYLAEELGVPVIIGPSGSSDVEAAYQITSQTDTVLISPSASSPSLTGLDGFWRTVGSDDVQGRILANIVLENIATQELDNEVHIVYENYSYGQNFYITMKDVFDNSSLSLDIKTHSYEIMDEAFLAEFRVSGAGGKSIVVIDADVSDLRFFMEDVFGDVGFENSMYYLTDSASNEFFLEGFEGDTSDMYKNIYGTRPRTIRGTEFENFAYHYRNFSEFEVDHDPYISYAYDAAWLGFVAYTYSGYCGDGCSISMISGYYISAVLRMLSNATIESEQNMDTEWLSIQEQLSKGDSVNIKGVTGSLDFDPLTDEVITYIEVWRVIDNDGDTPCIAVQRSCPSGYLDNVESCENNFEEEEYTLQNCD
jgi:hypothetical protein